MNPPARSKPRRPCLLLPCGEAESQGQQRLARRANCPERLVARELAQRGLDPGLLAELETAQQQHRERFATILSAAAGLPAGHETGGHSPEPVSPAPPADRCSIE